MTKMDYCRDLWREFGRADGGNTHSRAGNCVSFDGATGSALAQIQVSGSVAWCVRLPMLMCVMLSCSGPGSWGWRSFTCFSFSHHRLVFLRGHPRQLVDEGDDAPKCDVVMRAPPSRHAGHFDAMLDYPEGVSVVDAYFGEVGRLRIKTLSYLRIFHPGRQMTARAHRVVMIGSL